MEPLKPLIELAKKFKGYMAFAALIFLGMIWLLPKLFPKGVAGLPPEQFTLIIQFIFGGFFVITLVLAFLAYRKSDPANSGAIFIIVHDNKDKTAGIAGAEVRLALPVPQKGITNDKGSISFNFSSDYANNEYPVNAEKKGYEKRYPKNVKMKNGNQIWLALKQINQCEPAEEKIENSFDSGELPPLNRCPFIAGPKIEDPRLFVGREKELNFIISKMEGVQPVSVNLIGERRIGKSSLLFHIFQTWQKRIKNNGKYQLTYLSLQDIRCQTRDGFYTQAGSKFGADLNIKAYPENGEQFVKMLENMKMQHIRPVILLDEFEGFLKSPDQFFDPFYDHLRSLMDANLILFVIASHKPVDEYRKEQKLTSSFFNLGQSLVLKKMTDKDACALVRLPASTVDGAESVLNEDFQKLALEWGKSHPFLLQLACSSLCSAMESGKGSEWAEKQFNAQASRFEDLIKAEG